jgi:putative hydrolase of the HAD superfamily
MVRPRAFLVDVFDTILTCDYEALQLGVARTAGVPVDAWSAGFAEHRPALVDGRLSLAQLYAQLLRNCRVEPHRDLVAELVRRDQELLIGFSRLYEDSIPFLELLRSRDIVIAFISNCAEGTRALLDKFGVSVLADLSSRLPPSC